MTIVDRSKLHLAGGRLTRPRAGPGVAMRSEGKKSVARRQRPQPMPHDMDGRMDEPTFDPSQARPGPPAAVVAVSPAASRVAEPPAAAVGDAPPPAPRGRRGHGGRSRAQIEAGEAPPERGVGAGAAPARTVGGRARHAAGKAGGKPAEAGARPRGDRTRSDVAATLWRAAFDLFASQNFSTVTIKDIATTTGINPSMIYYYFGSKEELFLDVVETTAVESVRMFEAVAERARRPEDTIAMWIELHVNQFVLLQNLAKISLDYASTHTRTVRIDKAVSKFYDMESVILGEAIRAGIAAGTFRRVNVARTIVFISTFLDGALFRGMMFPDFNYKTAIRTMRTLVLEHLRGVQAA